MKKFARLSVVSCLGTILSSPAFVAAQSVHVTGGGTATFGADLDGDGEIDGSQFGMIVDIKGDGSAEGHRLFAMAGKPSRDPSAGPSVAVASKEYERR